MRGKSRLAGETWARDCFPRHSASIWVFSVEKHLSRIFTADGAVACYQNNIRVFFSFVFSRSLRAFNRFISRLVSNNSIPTLAEADIALAISPHSSAEWRFERECLGLTAMFSFVYRYFLRTVFIHYIGSLLDDRDSDGPIVCVCIAACDDICSGNDC